MRETAICGPTSVRIRRVLVAAGIYNLAWGLWVVLFPAAMFGVTEIEPPQHPWIWQCVGMIVGVYGIGYLIAAGDPVRHWPIVLVGLLGKTLGPVGFLVAALAGDLPWTWGWTVVTNDLIWWPPFAWFLYQIARESTDTSGGAGERHVAELISEVPSRRGATLAELSRERPTLLIFLRHAGCTFCRRALADLRRERALIEREGVRLAIVHMSQPLKATLRLQQYGLQDVHRFSDPHCVFYRAFDVPRGSLRQLLGPCVWWRGLLAGLWEGHGLGRLDGDGFRMSGMFLLSNGQIVASHRATTAADRPDYPRFAREALRQARRTGRGAGRSGTPSPRVGERQIR